MPPSPLWSTAAFSNIVTFRPASLALIAAKQPARPPPTTRTSVSSTSSAIFSKLIIPASISVLLSGHDLLVLCIDIIYSILPYRNGAAYPSTFYYNLCPLFLLRSIHSLPRFAPSYVLIRFRETRLYHRPQSDPVRLP